MPVNYNDLIFSKAAMHTIVPRHNDDPARPEFLDQVFQLGNNVQNTLRKRLVNAMGRRGKSFKLTIAKYDEGTFFRTCANLKHSTEDEFLEASKHIATLLANSQGHSNAPGGYLLFLQGSDVNTQKEWYIAIKADPHEALASSLRDGVLTIEVLDKIFLSPSQKLFKIGAIEEVNLELGEVNQQYNCYLFDDQFGNTDRPAVYFYDTFLGFSIMGNEKIQSMLYYKNTEDFIKKTDLLDTDQKQDALDALRIQFTVNREPTIRPEQFSETYFESVDLQRQYRVEVASKLPTNFLKDRSLINTRLGTKKIDFPSKIKISGPDENFDRNVRIIKRQEQLDALRANNEDITIIVIDGKPYR